MFDFNKKFATGLNWSYIRGDGTPPGEEKDEIPAGTFTPEQQAIFDKALEKRLAREKKANAAEKKRTEEVIATLEQLKKNKELTDQQKSEMENQIKHLERTIMTKEELSAKEKKELNDSLQNRLKETEAERDRWKNQHDTSMIERAIWDATREKAFDPNQFITFLKPNTKLIEEKVDGVSTGRYVPIVDFEGLDKDGKSIRMELPMADAVTEMEKMPARFGNLFKSGLTPGLGEKGAGGIGGDGKITDSISQDHDTYLKHRAEVLKQ